MQINVYVYKIRLLYCLQVIHLRLLYLTYVPVYCRPARLLDGLSNGFDNNYRVMICVCIFKSIIVSTGVFNLRYSLG